MAREVEVHQFHSLDGVRGGRLDGPFVRSPSAAVSALRSHRACSGAGSHGAVMAWIDDAGAYRVTLCRWQSVVESQTVKTKSAFFKAVRELWPLMTESVS